MRRDGVISDVFSLFVYVLIRKRLVISILSQHRGGGNEGNTANGDAPNPVRD